MLRQRWLIERKLAQSSSTNRFNSNLTRALGSISELHGARKSRFIAEIVCRSRLACVRRHSGIVQQHADGVTFTIPAQQCWHGKTRQADDAQEAARAGRDVGQALAFPVAES